MEESLQHPEIWKKYWKEFVEAINQISTTFEKESDDEKSRIAKEFLSKLLLFRPDPTNPPSIIVLVLIVAAFIFITPEILPVKQEDLVNLNVGGTTFQVKRETLKTKD